MEHFASQYSQIRTLTRANVHQFESLDHIHFWLGRHRPNHYMYLTVKQKKYVTSHGHTCIVAASYLPHTLHL